MRNLTKWVIVGALGVFGVAACTLATVDLTEVGAAEHGYTETKHVSAPWRMVPPVFDFNAETDRSDANCNETPQGELCAYLETDRTTKSTRYATASFRGNWPLTVGLEYVCTRHEINEVTHFVGDLDGERITDPLVFKSFRPDYRERVEHDVTVYYTLGGFTPGEGQVVIFADGAENANGLDIKGEAGKYIEITDEFAVNSVRFAETTIQATVVRNTPYTGGKRPGAVTFEMRGAQNKFEAVDRMCFNSVE